jgi:hypothetical protein
MVVSRDRGVQGMMMTWAHEPCSIASTRVMNAHTPRVEHMRHVPSNDAGIHTRLSAAGVCAITGHQPPSDQACMPPSDASAVCARHERHQGHLHAAAGARLLLLGRVHSSCCRRRCCWRRTLPRPCIPRHRQHHHGCACCMLSSCGAQAMQPRRWRCIHLGQCEHHHAVCWQLQLPLLLLQPKLNAARCCCRAS